MGILKSYRGFLAFGSVFRDNRNKICTRYSINDVANLIVKNGNERTNQKMRKTQIDVICLNLKSHKL
jgi:hypothetical protein